MTFSAKNLAALLGLGLLLGGCGTGPRAHTRVPDWEEPGSAVTQLAPEPAIAPPPGTAPAEALPGPATNQANASSGGNGGSNANSGSAPAGGSPPGVPSGWVALETWTKTTGLASLSRQTVAPVPTFFLRSTNGALVLRTGSQIAYWDGLELRLGFAPQLIDGHPYVHALDVHKTLHPLVTGAKAWNDQPTPTIVIDPGHGGENAGTRSILGSHFEKEYTLDWAMRLQKILAAHGWQVWLTRSNDTDLALSNRVAVATDHKADLFLSLHFNSSAPNQTQVGLETYCLTPAGMPSSLTRGFEDDPATVFPNNAFDAQNLQLALRVHRALLQVNGHHDRGVRHARFPGVLRNQQRPSILVEGGYLSNPQEARLIADPAYRQKLAEAVARALADKPQEWSFSRSHFSPPKS